MRTIIAFTCLLFLVSPLAAQVVTVDHFPGLSFSGPTDLQNAGDGSDRLFVSELDGLIWVFDNDSTTTQKSVFLDIQSRVGGQEGLIGIAFHPDYANNGYFYCNYTASSPNRSVIARFETSASNPDTAIADSARVILEVAQPFGNHNGGAIAFGPDGYLYIPFGDGGGQHDPSGNGQNTSTLLGSIVRIDVDNPTGGMNYSIPADNPFVDSTGVADEIYAYGFRNPWRSSFDHENGRYWVADVGQDDYEEIDIVTAGRNYGWDIMEADSCHEPATGCDTTGLVRPVWFYTHALGNSITGGYVYRGGTISYLWGKYIFGDWASGRIWALSYDGTHPAAAVELLDESYQITSFGVDEAGEIYVCGWDTGKIYKLEPATGTGVGRGTPPVPGRLAQNYPNPFTPSTRIEFTIDHRAMVEVRVYDVSGRRVATLVGDVMDPGAHVSTWNGTGSSGNKMPTGIYFYTLRVDGELIEARRMLLLK